ncbi:MAG: ABC transporter permease subunit [Chloroflexota bacterium]|nr:ABC transporter permease subunit [Chloroflexota bacterium]
MLGTTLGMLAGFYGGRIDDVLMRVVDIMFGFPGLVLAVKEEPYMEAARVLGAADLRLVRWHVLPNVVAPLIVMISVYLSQAILSEAALSFLGLGTQPPKPSWGGMLSAPRARIWRFRQR